MLEERKGELQGRSGNCCMQGAAMARGDNDRKGKELRGAWVQSVEGIQNTGHLHAAFMLEVGKERHRLERLPQPHLICANQKGSAGDFNRPGGTFPMENRIHRPLGV